MNKDKLEIVLDLYKNNQITKDEAYKLLEDPIVERIQPIQIEPSGPYTEPWSPFGPLVTYCSKSTPIRTCSQVNQSIQQSEQ